MTIYVHEFLYRGRAPGSTEPPAWHLILASDAKDEMGRNVAPGPALSMAQATAAGWGLPEIVAAINADLLAEAETLRAARDGQEAEIEQLRTEKATVTAERDALAAQSTRTA
jgi:hypothetical protein